MEKTLLKILVISLSLFLIGNSVSAEKTLDQGEYGKIVEKIQALDDKCNVEESKGPGADVPQDLCLRDNESASAEIITVGSPTVEAKVQTALAAGMTEHDMDGSIDDLMYRDKTKFIYEWIRDNMGYLCDFENDDSCNINAGGSINSMCHHIGHPRCWCSGGFRNCIDDGDCMDWDNVFTMVKSDFNDHIEDNCSTEAGDVDCVKSNCIDYSMMHDEMVDNQSFNIFSLNENVDSTCVDDTCGGNYVNFIGCADNFVDGLNQDSSSLFSTRSKYYDASINISGIEYNIPWSSEAKSCIAELSATSPPEDWKNCVKKNADLYYPAEDVLANSGSFASSPDSYYGDCDDYANLYTAMLRTAGVSSDCVYTVQTGSHALNAVLSTEGWKYLDAQAGSYSDLPYVQALDENCDCEHAYNDYNRSDDSIC